MTLFFRLKKSIVEVFEKNINNYLFFNIGEIIFILNLKHLNMIFKTFFEILITLLQFLNIFYSQMISEI